MASHESAYKTALVKKVRAEGAYARRIEDQFGVGILDLVVCTRTTGVVFLEAKLIRNGSFVATPRQRVEADRITASGGRAALLGYCKDTGKEYVSRVSDVRTRASDATERRPGETFTQFLERYYNGG